MSNNETSLNITEDRFNNLFKKGNFVVSLVGLCFTLFVLYTGFFGFLPNLMQRSVFVGFALFLAYFVKPHFFKKDAKKPMGLFAYLCAVFSVITTGWVVINYDRFMMFSTQSSSIDLIFAVILVLLLLEAARRVTGPIFFLLTFLTIVYAFVGPWLPGNFAHGGFSFEYIAQHLYISSYGIWGTTTGVMVGMVAMFIILGNILTETGGSRIFVSIATALAGKTAGGTAKVAAVGSSLFGMVSGSASANAAVIGAMTIPMMKKSGYKPEFAAAVEAVAGTGGQIMPPIMGAGAFLIAQNLGITYLSVAMAAVIPAVIYYVGLFSGIHFWSLKRGMRGLSSEELKEYRKELTFKKLFTLFVPMGLLIAFLVRGYTVSLSGVYSIFVAVLLYVFSDFDRRAMIGRIKGIIVALSSAGRDLILLALIGACADIVIGMLSLTGLGVEISSAIYNISGGVLIIGLVLAMITTIILGMGLPTTAAYVLASSVVVPAMTQFEINPLAIHIFLFYFACMSAFTPPVCVAIYIASSIAQADWVRAGVIATMLGVGGFIVPYVAIYQSSILMQGSAFSILFSFIVMIAAACMLTAGLIGNFFANINIILRIMLIIGALSVIYPAGYISSVFGVSIGIIVLIVGQLKKQRNLKGVS